MNMLWVIALADFVSRRREPPPLWAVIVGVIVLIVSYYTDNRRRESVWVHRVEREVSRHPGATVQRGSFYQERRVTIPGPPVRAEVRWWSHVLDSGGRPRRVRYTEYIGQVPMARRRLRIATEGWKDGTVPVERPLQTGDSAFDLAYSITASDDAWARSFLDDVMRDRIRRLDALHSGPFLLFIRGDQVIVRVNGRLEEEHRLDQFLEDCKAIAEASIGRDPGVEVTEVSATADATCQVCGDAIGAARRVHCRSCRTAHHDDCWKYNDGCSVFGCGERKSTPA